MSADAHAAHGHGHDDHGHDDGRDHGSMKSYLIGFFLSVVLTAIPFWLVMTGVIENKNWTIAIVVAFAVVQIVVHMIYFLHMKTTSDAGWTMMALIFTIIIVVIALSGSLWVMYHLNVNMMPVHDMRNMP
ncbi:cytochrome o ubiquinol oxidase subunit IV [Tardiphaga robiniae]|uniref:Cytochrome bo(3) ubiquinol oxidase subunit 4 n=1 Tax=Tardiphaga robiniae TaxID=943830 RepID=A0A120MG88_9BRAD|nr:cytochrome o ubiquinol oxidase subunit IV [Tardiphaga robiniae]AMH39625.1 Cytochrome bo(3) ubiquinol oxidase subunit 4 [Tardiphaga robiniae]KZD25579.1 cytochrome o ubiquinol oxidase subunit IV [Tardiphaga robiniae]